MRKIGPPDLTGKFHPILQKYHFGLPLPVFSHYPVIDKLEFQFAHYPLVKLEISENRLNHFHHNPEYCIIRHQRQPLLYLTYVHSNE